MSFLLEGRTTNNIPVGVEFHLKIWQVPMREVRGGSATAKIGIFLDDDDNPIDVREIRNEFLRQTKPYTSSGQAVATSFSKLPVKTQNRIALSSYKKLPESRSAAMAAFRMQTINARKAELRTK